MSLKEIPQVELNLNDDEKQENNEDLYRHCRQRIASSGRIFVSKKAWALRVTIISALIVFMI